MDGRRGGDGRGDGRRAVGMAPARCGLWTLALSLALIGPSLARAAGGDPIAGDPGLVTRPEGIVTQVGVTVRPEGSSARVAVEYQITLEDDGSAWTRIGLAGLVLGRVVEGERDLAVRPSGESWAVELRGRGDHRIEVESTAPVRSGPGGDGVDLVIPPAASTRVALVSEHPLADARAGPDEPLVLAVGDARRADGHLRPRPRLELAWRPADPPGPIPEPLLAARGEVAARPGPDGLSVDESWTMTPLRGSVRSLTLPVEPGDEAPIVRVDDREAPAKRRPRASGVGEELHLDLAEPWTEGPAAAPHVVRVTTRRPYPPRSADGSVGLRLVAHPPQSTVTGVVLGVAPSEAWQVEPGDNPAWARVDPRTLSPATRGGSSSGAAGAWLAWAGDGTPAALALTLRPARPRFQARMQSAVTLGEGRATVAATLTGAVERGRLFEARVEIPSGLRWEPPVAGPSGLSVRLDDLPGPDRAGPSPTGATLIARFDPPLDAGQTFALGLRGSCSIPNRGSASIGLFRVVEPVPTAAEIALVAGPGRRATLAETGGALGLRRVEADRPPDEWVWPGGSASPADSAVAWFRSDRSGACLPLAIEPVEPAVRHRSTLSVAVDRREAEVVEEVTGDVASGTLRALEVALPPEIADRWAVEAGEGIEREPLGDDPATGWRRYRLKLTRPADSFQFRGHYRLDFESPRNSGPPGAAGPLRLAIRPIAVRAGRSSGRVVRIAADPDVALTTEAPGWTARRPPPRPGGDSAQEVRAVWEDAGSASPTPIAIAATPGRLADLPTTVASRLWLRTAQRGEGGLSLSARYRLEAHERTVTIRLPRGSRWARGTAGGLDLGPGAVEQLDATTFRITLPPGLALGPLALHIDAQVDDDAATPDPWPAPELVGGAVQQTVWELVLTGARVGVGVPDGWTDENHWVRRGLVWRREPSRLEAGLDRWIANEPPGDRDAAPSSGRPPGGTALPAGPTDDIESEAQVRYVFSHPGPPRALHFVTLARSTLLLVCSGPVLLVGLLVLVRRPPARWVGAGLLAAAFAAAVALEANTALLALESSALGFALTGIAIVLHQIIDRRGGTPAQVVIDVTAYGSAPEPTEPGTKRDEVTQASPPPPVDGATTIYPAPGDPGPSRPDEATVAIAPGSLGDEAR